MRQLRAARGVSQEDFADACGLHRTAVGLLERGERWPRLDNLTDHFQRLRNYGFRIASLIEKGVPNPQKRRRPVSPPRAAFRKMNPHTLDPSGTKWGLRKEGWEDAGKRAKWFSLSGQCRI